MNNILVLFYNLVYKKILRLEEELEALGGGGDDGGETTRSNVIKTPNLTPKKVSNYFLYFVYLFSSFVF
jgi:hypothetical protein